MAYYEFGVHAIPTNPVQHIEGTNLVMKRGNSGQIQAWYTRENGSGFHSIWNYSKNNECKDGSTLIEDAHPEWGDYLTPDTDYCVKVNEF